MRRSLWGQIEEVMGEKKKKDQLATLLTHSCDIVSDGFLFWSQSPKLLSCHD